ncbi:MAG: DUF4256 domain-containing protein [Spirochaetia bacterium]|nr:DUF4256 domain-containing protein [Spirochaetia bacterium]MCF7941567.1 DUF4256 domain-containing protein [Spirochaetia bacterium]
MPSEKRLDQESRTRLMSRLKSRFEQHMDRHAAMSWEQVKTRLEAQPEKLWSLGEMEDTSGEPDVVGFDPDSGEYLFVDCAPESPKGRRSICYDREGRTSRTEHRPKQSAVEMAEKMAVDILTEQQYRALQGLEPFDLKSSSWVKTPQRIRDLGGALFGDRRYDTVFIYHNGASSYYAVRGFRAMLRV